jgi:hypothetical protein
MTATEAPARPATSAPTAAAVLTLLGAAAYLVLTGIQITNPTFDDYLTTTVDYVNDGSFFAGLLLSLGGLWGLRRWGAPLAAVVIAGVGQVLVAFGVSVALVTGVSPDWFVVVGLPGNLIAWIGLIWLGVWAWRRRATPRWVAVLMMLSVPIGVGVAEQGGSIVTAVLWCAVGAQLLRKIP